MSNEDSLPFPPKPKSGNANDFVEQQLDHRLDAIESHLSADALGFSGPITAGVDDIWRAVVEKKHSKNSGREKLVVLLTTTGGYIEVVQRIVDILRKHYVLVDFIIPNYAYSAGTVLAMSGDAIHMNYYSRLGPIDPQVETPGGRMVPALGYLERYDALIQKAVNGKISTAEVQLLIQGFDQGELYQYDQARELSIALLKEWLVKYKFKNWKETRTRKVKVTEKLKESRAASIAKKLNDTKRWHVHGHGISKEVLDKDLDVLIDDFSADGILSTCIREYDDLLSDYMAKMSTAGAIHCVGEYRVFMVFG
ncbi:MAG: SDH family Clp fold serine proteinase [Bryobacteraceae bacterium]